MRRQEELAGLLAEDEGYEDPYELLQEVVYASVQPGICRECEATTTRCEPDARDNWCHNCGCLTVSSISVLMGVM